MKFLRKALLPTVAVVGFLGFMGLANAAGPNVTLDFAASDGDVCRITGPIFIEEGENVDYVAVVQNPDTGLVSDDWEIDVDLNDFNGGDSDIESINGVSINSVDFVDDAELIEGANVCGDADDDIEADQLAANKAFFLQFILDGIDNGEVCSGLPPLSILACQEPSPTENGGPNDTAGPTNDFPYNEADIDCGLVNSLGDQCSISNAVITAVVNAVAEAALTEPDCSNLDEVAEDAANLAGATEFVGSQFEDYFEDECDFDGTIVGEPDGYVTVDVTCYEPGTFDLSFAPEGGKGASIEVVCGSDVETGEIFAVPTSVEINPSVANVAHSLIWVSLKGDNGEIAFPGTEVMWITDRCAIESIAVDSEDEFEAAEGLFRSLNPVAPITAVNIEASTFANTAPDGASRQQEEVNTFKVTGSAATNFAERTISAVILHCDPIHAPNQTPGPATITAFVERGDDDIDDDDLDGNIADNDDLVLKTTVTVVGPPAASGVTVTAAPASLACGEKATVTVDVKDAAGQPVSDHTWVEAVTNAGGVLAGTGAVAGQQGLVTPVSSTIAETFGGKATLYLLTSTAHVGKYEVVVTTGGGGGVGGQLINGQVVPTTNLLGGLFNTPPISVQVTVECSVPQVAAPTTPPSTSGPTTGQGIRPPSTGDAGLVSTDSSWVAGAAFAVVASLVIAGFSVKLVRED